MKILCLHTTRDGRHEIMLGADSAMLRPGEPVFLPDDTEGWLSVVAPAVRISRLGTAIKAGNAHAYRDSIGLVHLLLPEHSVVPPLALDRAISPGQWVNADSDTRYEVKVCRNPIGGTDPRPQMLSFTLGDLDADNAIARLSENMTFRTGDIIIFADKGSRPEIPELDTEIRATLASDGTALLDIRLK